MHKFIKETLKEVWEYANGVVSAPLYAWIISHIVIGVAIAYPFH